MERQAAADAELVGCGACALLRQELWDASAQSRRALSAVEGSFAACLCCCCCVGTAG